MSLRVVCSGTLVRYPAGGHIWHHLQYLVGLVDLGVDVTYVEEYGWPRSCYDPEVDDMTDDPGYGWRFLHEALDRAGVAVECCFVTAAGDYVGLSEQEVAERLAGCDCYLSLSNVNSFPLAGLARRRAVVDTDPVFTQLRVHGLQDPGSFDARFSYAENLGRPGCTVPDDGLAWLVTRQPVVARLWAPTRGDRAAPFTTVTNWSSYGEQVVDGVTYGQKDRQFEEIRSLPRSVDVPLEIALGGTDAVAEDLRASGWGVVDGGFHTRTPEAYQQYLRASAGELSVAKHAYVVTASGWFSDRTCGYLASGRPAVVEDTGFSRFLPCGAGLLPFRTGEDAARQLLRALGDYDAHCRAARALIEEEFAAEKVLGRMLEQLL